MGLRLEYPPSPRVALDAPQPDRDSVAHGSARADSPARSRSIGHVSIVTSTSEAADPARVLALGARQRGGESEWRGSKRHQLPPLRQLRLPFAPHPERHRGLGPSKRTRPLSAESACAKHSVHPSDPGKATSCACNHLKNNHLAHFGYIIPLSRVKSGRTDMRLSRARMCERGESWTGPVHADGQPTASPPARLSHHPNRARVSICCPTRTSSSMARVAPT